MVKAKIPLTTQPAPDAKRPRQARTKSTSESSLLLLRMRELDREFARQTKHLTALTKRLGKKLTGMGPD
jgi:hypothetical protein